MTTVMNIGADNRKTHPALLIFVFTLLGLVLMKRIEELDVWYHLVIGDEIVRTMRIPLREFFVYTQLGDPVAFHEWGFGVLFNLAYRAGGYWGMSIVNAGVAAVTLFFLYGATRRRLTLDPLPLLILFLLLWFISHRLVYRPEMMLFLFLAAEFFFLERYAGTRLWKWLLPIPLLTFMLSNFHPSSIFLLGLLGFYGAQCVIDAGTGRDKGRTALLFFAVTMASLMTAAVNPYGFQQVFLPFRFAGSTQLLESIVEFLPTFRTGYWVHYVIVLGGSLLLLLIQPKRRLLDWFLFLAFGWLGFKYVRNVALFALVMYVPVVKTCDDLAERYKVLQTRVFRGGLWAGAMAAFAVFAVLPVFRGSWGAGAVESALPVQSAEVLTRVRPPGQLFNFYDYGGYLAWALRGQYRVSIDGRHYGTDRSLLLHDEIFQAATGWQNRLGDLGVTMVVAPAVLPYSGKLIPLITKLALDPEWALVVREPAGLLFVRKSAIAGSGIVPLDTDLVWQEVMSESRSVLRDYPERGEAYLSLGKAALLLRDLPQALNAYRAYVAMKPDDQEARVVLTLLESGRMGSIR